MRGLHFTSMPLAFALLAGTAACGSSGDAADDDLGTDSADETDDDSGDGDADTGDGDGDGSTEPSQSWHVPVTWPNFATARDGRVALTRAEGPPPLGIDRLDPKTGEIAKSATIEGTNVGYVPYISGVITSDDAYVFHQIGQGSVAELVALTIDGEPRELWRTQTADSPIVDRLVASYDDQFLVQVESNNNAIAFGLFEHPSGNERWTFQGGNGQLTPEIRDWTIGPDGVVVVGAVEEYMGTPDNPRNWIAWLSADNGSVERELFVEPGLDWRVVEVDDVGNIYVGAVSSLNVLEARWPVLARLSNDGEVLWSVQSGSAVEPMESPAISPYQLAAAPAGAGACMIAENPKLNAYSASIACADLDGTIRMGETYEGTPPVVLGYYENGDWLIRERSGDFEGESQLTRGPGPF